ncbi:peptide deformylase [Kineosporia succinea]|uniref:Peptide deformylase n=1 Tax=Kineosporia succinea TaxID=84632 RepID=A0ABT9PEP8_9ACTN|nr:peptide deformylase [Kineosporia succinea]MDP9830879.1 peptide deformylase [Kineosporia succinea]
MTNELAGLVRSVLDEPRPWKVTQVGAPVLRQTAVPYDGQLDEALLHELLDAMRAHLPGVGVGLAAPQIGIGLAVAVIEDPGGSDPAVNEVRERPAQPLLELVNPVVTPIGDEKVAFYEGCLSVEGLGAVVSRYRRVLLKAQDRHGKPYEAELSGWPARIAQHETDHLNGTIYLDRAEIRSLSTVSAMQERWNQPTPAEASAVLGFPLRQR